MKRQDIQLLAAARQGDLAACCEIGRRYLHGSDGFVRHQRTALSYLTGPHAAHSLTASHIVAEGMLLHDILATGNEPRLRHAALTGSREAQLKLAAWLLICTGGSEEARTCLRAAADMGSAAALDAIKKLDICGSETVATHLLTLHCSHSRADVAALHIAVARDALRQADVNGAMRCLGVAIELGAPLTTEIAHLVSKLIHLAEVRGDRLGGRIPVSFIERCLELVCDGGDKDALYLYGRALCGLSVGSLLPEDLSEHPNVRKGSALLLRAADSGVIHAWLDLYRLHSMRRSIVNVPMARVFLEKAANRGQPAAQRILGALLMSESGDLQKAEAAVNWLYLASQGGDPIAPSLLASLVVSPQGEDADASAAIEDLRRYDPSLAARLQLARHFGLTKREALTVNPAAGRRAWGLVIDRNPVLSQSGLAAPRVVPALSAASMQSLQHAAAMYGQARHEDGHIESELRRRSCRLRKAVIQSGIQESMFFSEIPASSLQAMRCGPRWAFRCRQLLHAALLG